MGGKLGGVGQWGGGGGEIGQRKTYSGVGAMVGGAGREEGGIEMRLARQKDQQVQH
jgi:hypothetical protein